MIKNPINPLWIDEEIREIVMDFNKLDFAKTHHSCAGYGIAADYDKGGLPHRAMTPYLMVEYKRSLSSAIFLSKMERIWGDGDYCSPLTYALNNIDHNNVLVSHRPNRLTHPSVLQWDNRKKVDYIKECWHNTHELIKACL